ncbi:MAG: DinB family protein [Acidobacteria bacterium]|nr:MAG: DinB family protein [Acidobacteriota bacterium]
MRTPLHPQLEQLQRELQQAGEQASRLAASVDEGIWARRPEPGRWSAAECVVHLNLTSEAYIPLIEYTIRQGREREWRGNGPYRRDPIGWLLARIIEPPARLRVKTTAPFVPRISGQKDEIVGEFLELQKRLEDQVEAANGLNLNRLRIASPFYPRVRYNLFSGFKILAAHERRHLWQAEQAVGVTR